MVAEMRIYSKRGFLDMELMTGPIAIRKYDF